MSKLLPANHEAFRTKAYWDHFFQERDNEAFEWYGSYQDVQHFIAQHIPDQNAAVLTIGCGNSEFSHHMYDSGGYHNIHNLDYSAVVIDEMKAKNTRNKRPGMFWDLGDMTQMTSYTDGQYAAVCDKGALDALMSVDSADVRAKAMDMFSEITRVLAPGGKYLCITLAEPYIVKELMAYFVDGGVVCDVDNQQKWMIQAETFTPVEAGPFCPICLIFTKLRVAIAAATSATAASASPILCRIDAAGRAVTKPERLSASTFCQRMESVQDFRRQTVGISQLQPGRFDTYELWSENNELLSESHQTIPRFTLNVLDVTNAAADSGRIACAVFFIPQGKEAHFQFCTSRGLEGIAELANCLRLIAVRCNRPHSFPPNLALLQTELDPMVGPLLPAHAGEKVPYVAIPDEGGWEVVGEGISDVSGAYIVEEADPTEDQETGEPEGSVLRRLVFLCSQHFIQSEIRLIVNSSASTSAATAALAPADRLCAAHGWDIDPIVGLAFDPSYIDGHHKAVLVGLALCAGSKPNELRTQSSSHAIVIGLGGGAFPMALQHYAPTVTQYVCDLDPHMLEIAVRYFAYKPAETTYFAPCDGVAYLAHASASAKGAAAPTSPALALFARPDTLHAAAMKLPTSPVDMIFLDVDGRDESSGISAPPQPFTTLTCLQNCWDLLLPGGLLAINVVAKKQEAVEAFEKSVCRVFQTANSAAATKEVDIREMMRAAISGDGDIDFGTAVAGGRSDDDVDIDIDIDDDEGATTATSASADAVAGTVFRLIASEDAVNQTLLCIKGSVAETNQRGALLRSWLNSGSGSSGEEYNDELELAELLPLLTPL